MVNETLKLEQEQILSHGTGFMAYNFALYHEGADIEALQEVVLERGTGEDIYQFARDITDADREKLRNRLVELTEDWECNPNILNMFDRNLGIEQKHMRMA